jgi:hypothetical protein
MLDSNLKVKRSERTNFFEKPKSKIMPSNSIFEQVEDRTVLPSTINLWGGGGGGHAEKQKWK